MALKIHFGAWGSGLPSTRARPSTTALVIEQPPPQIATARFGSSISVWL
jgi:hypothetical protein